MRRCRQRHKGPLGWGHGFSSPAPGLGLWGQLLMGVVSRYVRRGHPSEGLGGSIQVRP